MKKQLIKVLVSILSLYLMTNIFHFAEASGITPVILFGVVLWLINLLVRPLLLLVVLPINVITLGIFTLIVNTWMIMLVDKVLKGIHIPNFWVAFLLALLIKILNSSFKKINKAHSTNS